MEMLLLGVKSKQNGEGVPDSLAGWVFTSGAVPWASKVAKARDFETSAGDPGH